MRCKAIPRGRYFIGALYRVSTKTICIVKSGVFIVWFPYYEAAHTTFIFARLFKQRYV